ncbi:hypothetical protein QR680_010258 [Steinernema hermaphroditum]|uniref:Glycoside hydrolase family 19 catalytic domain-containing protein n=1 Tax=Steinernema hermaphroditum TaxID=289476 RepID=A0AA39MAD3_9BILA|nr:hypothetical protein QR680_010258 [Steinernema hermaphroditum]
MWSQIWSILQAVALLNVNEENGNGVLPEEGEQTGIPTFRLTTESPNSIVDKNAGSVGKCPKAAQFSKGPPSGCQVARDPQNRPPSSIESWFTKEMFEDLFPFANLGFGPHPCYPYSYESFIIAARYFPKFGAESPNSNYTERENHRRDLAAFFAHAVQETGENNIGLYNGKRSNQEAANCFYRGGFYNWFEGGPKSAFFPPNAPGFQPEDGANCTAGGEYCQMSPENNFWCPCETKKITEELSSSCYFGRGAIQISYNYNYKRFQDWLESENIFVDLLKHPNLVITSMEPPLAIMASLWFYMTPQPPKPSMHDLVMGNWNAGAKNKEIGYFGPNFGATSLVINNECNGESPTEPGEGGESRRIKAFKWFCNYFNVPVGPEESLSCKKMKVRFDLMRYPKSFGPKWSTAWKNEPCDCEPAGYEGWLMYYDPEYYPEEYVALNEVNRRRCVEALYAQPSMYGMSNATSACLDFARDFDEEDKS